MCDTLGAVNFLFCTIHEQQNLKLDRIIFDRIVFGCRQGKRKRVWESMQARGGLSIGSNFLKTVQLFQEN